MEKLINELFGLSDKERKKFDKNRQKINKKILKNLQKYINKYPQIRFGQALYALNIIDKEDIFNEEPEAIYKRMRKI